MREEHGNERKYTRTLKSNTHIPQEREKGREKRVTRGRLQPTNEKEETDKQKEEHKQRPRKQDEETLTQTAQKKKPQPVITLALKHNTSPSAWWPGAPWKARKPVPL